MKAVLLASVLAIVAAVSSGCSTREESALAIGAIAGGLVGNSVGRGRGRLAATAVGAMIGGLVGSKIGRSLDKRDRELARLAEYEALERGRAGQRFPWRNPDSGRYGEVVPQLPYKRGTVDCREYTHTVVIEGRPEVLRGSACRNPDGTWSSVG